MFCDKCGKRIEHSGTFCEKCKENVKTNGFLKIDLDAFSREEARVETVEVSPVVGTEKQSEELVHYLLNDFNDNPAKIWDSNIFGKSLNELVNEGLHNKLGRMPEEAQFKLQETLTKIINEGSGGLICLIL